MSRVELRHKLTVEGVDQIIRRDGATMIVSVSDAEIRRFCYGVLADVDPDEAEIIIGSVEHKRQDRKTLMLILRRLLDGPCGSRQIARLLDEPVCNVNGRMMALANAGHVQRVASGGRKGERTHFQITEAGKAAIKQGRG